MQKIVTGLGNLFYWIPISFTRTRMTRQEAPHPHTKTLLCTIFFNRFFHIGRARGGIATCWSEMSERVLIGCNEEGEKFFHMVIISRTCSLLPEPTCRQRQGGGWGVS